MKEATGEANMTIITVVLIGIVSAAAMLIVPNLIKDTKKKSCCTNAGGEWKGNNCVISGLADQETYDACVKEVNA